MRHGKKRRTPSGFVVLLAASIALIAFGIFETLQTQTAESQVEQSEVSPHPLASPHHVKRSHRPQGCNATPKKSYAPARIKINGVGKRDVQRLPRFIDESGNISSPAPTEFNPSVYAWDEQSSKVGQQRGNILLTAHTYHTDDSALGNRLLAELAKGDLIRIESKTGKVTCYRVTDRREVPVQQYPAKRVYESKASSRVVITVCSGFDGESWTKRTLWVARPVK